MKQFKLITLFLMLIFLTACGGSDDSAPELQSITVSGIDSQYIQGQQATVTVIGKFSNGQSSTVTGVEFQSSDTAIASVSSNGVINFISPGEVTITGSAQGFSASQTVEVVAPSITALSIGIESDKVSLGNTLQLTIQATLNNDTQTTEIEELTLNTSDETIATVNNNGLIETLSTGSFEVTATSGDISATKTITVTDAQLVSINVQLQRASIADGTQTTAIAIGTFTDKSKANLNPEWTIDDASIASINDEGVITGNAPGEVTIIATSENIISNSVTLIVTNAVATGLIAEVSQSNVAVGLMLDLNAILTFSNNSTQIIENASWSIDDESLAKIITANNATKLIANATGVIAVTAEAQGFIDTINITITPAIAQSISITPTQITIPNGTSETIEVRAVFSDQTEQNITNDAILSIADTAIGVLSIPQSGAVKFSATSEGQTSLIASYRGFNATIGIDVTAATPVNIVPIESTISIAAGLSEELSFIVNYSDGTTSSNIKGASWAVTKGSNAMLSADGGSTATISSNSQGSIEVTATFAELSTTFIITITEAVPISLELNIPTLYKGDERIQATAFANMSDGTQQNITNQVLWSSSNEAVATISNDEGQKGVINALLEGELTFTAALENSNEITNSTEIVLQPRIITGFEILNHNNTGSITIGQGEYSFTIDMDGRSSDLVSAYSYEISRSVGAIAFSQISQADAFNFSSSSKGVDLTKNSDTSIGVLRNNNQMYALFQIHEVRTANHNADFDAIVFSYVIRTDGKSDFSNVSFGEQVKLIQCVEPDFFNYNGGCNELLLPYSMSSSSSVSRLPRPSNFKLGQYAIIPLGQNINVTNVIASDSNNIVTPFISGLTDGALIERGRSRYFELFIPATSGRTAQPVFQFRIDNDSQKSFSYMGSFTSN